jgi:hypothetical protein
MFSIFSFGLPTLLAQPRHRIFAALIASGTLAGLLGSVRAAESPPYREFYVSPTGTDTNPGTAKLPLGTLEGAREAVRKVLPDARGDVIVTFRGGTYPIRQTVVFVPEDSPAGNSRVIYRAAAGQMPVFSGGTAVTGWAHFAGQIWTAPLHRQSKLRALYVNGVRAVMPHSETIQAQGGWGTYTVKAGQAPWAWESGTEADGICYKISDLPKIIRNPEDVEIENRTTWNTNFVCVREIGMENGNYIFKLQQPYGAIAQRIGWSAGLTVKGSQIIHNAFELLNQPGEFYFDRARQMLYYIPRQGEDMTTATVIVPETETLLALSGQSPGHPVRNLTFQGLGFSYTDYRLFTMDHSSGAATGQTACINTAFGNPSWHLDIYRSYDVLPGAIVCNAIDNVEFTRNTITHTGCEGIVMANAIVNSRLVGNVIRDAGGCAISVGHPQHVYENDTADIRTKDGAGIEHEKFPAPGEAAPRHILIADNYLPDDAVLFNGHTIITVFFGEDIQLVHNWIVNAPYSGISMGWGWCEFDGSPASKLPGHPTTAAKNNLIRANRIEHTMLRLHDGGGIYTVGAMPGTLIDRNYVNGTMHAIYNDEGSVNVTARENVTEHCKTNYKADTYGRKHSIRVENPFAAEDKFLVTAPDSEVIGKTICPNGQWTSEARDIMDQSGLEPAFADIAKTPPETR